MEKYNLKKLARVIAGHVISQFLATGVNYISNREMLLILGFKPTRLIKYTNNPNFLKYLKKHYAITFEPMKNNNHLKKFELDVKKLRRILKSLEGK